MLKSSTSERSSSVSSEAMLFKARASSPVRIWSTLLYRLANIQSASSHPDEPIPAKYEKVQSGLVSAWSCNPRCHTAWFAFR